MLVFACSDFLPAGISGPQAGTNFALSGLVYTAAVIFLTYIHFFALLLSCRIMICVEVIQGGSVFTAKGDDPLCMCVYTRRRSLQTGNALEAASRVWCAVEGQWQ